MLPLSFLLPSLPSSLLVWLPLPAKENEGKLMKLSCIPSLVSEKPEIDWLKNSQELIYLLSFAHSRINNSTLIRQEGRQGEG